MKQKYYITTAIAYTSAKPHIGNTYEAVLADSIARFRRRQGYDVFFQTGTDEHGQKIEEKAEKAGKTPKQYVDEVSTEIRAIWDLMNVSYDKFIRTTDRDHEEQVAAIFKKFYEQGDIYKGAYEGWYCTPCESFWTESQLKDGKCPDCGRPVEKAKEEAYFFKMSKYAPRLIDYLNEHPGMIAPKSRLNEMMNNFLRPGLQDLCVSRTSFRWGIPVDFDPKHVVYVWLDALTNYITGLGYKVNGESDDNFKKYWPADIHVIGKDIIRFHTIYWPVFLMALGLPLPKHIFGHPWLLQEGGKMSKSKGNVMYADDLVSVYGVDAVRYYVLDSMPFDNDGLISWDMMTEKINADLANVYGNLVKRTIAMSNKYFGGVVERGGADLPLDEELKETACAAYDKMKECMDGDRISDAIDCVFTLLRRANKYIDETTPWILAKDPADAPRLKTVMYNLTEAIVIATSLLEPFIPDTAAEVCRELNTSLRSFEDMGKFGLYADGTKVVEDAPVLFPRFDGKEVAEKAAAIAAKYAVPERKEEPAEEKPAEIGIEDFMKISLKTALVKDCVKIEKSKKLLKLTLKIGSEERTVASGIAEYYKPEELIGKKVVVVANLKPVELCGVESRGMILCAEKDGKVVVVTPDDPSLPDGATVR